MTHGTRVAAMPEGVTVTQIDSHAAFVVGDIEVRPFPVPHDAREPVQFVFSDGRSVFGLLTDTGCVTPHMIAMLSACDALMLECNHDLDLLADGNYPVALKRRIAGRFGHLDNASAADLLARIDHRRLKHVVAAHLSQENNRPELARGALASVLGCAQDWIGVADQDNGLDWRDVAA
jgi:phosphoribosyl 1,2-cyclic phosphodiesterase